MRNLHRILDVIFAFLVEFSVEMVFDVTEAVLEFFVDFINDVV